MTTDLCGEDIIVRLSSPQIISTEPAVSARAAAGGVELGRRLLLAARAGDTPAVLDLMAKGAPFTTDWLGTSPLHLAAANNHVDTCAVLLRAGVSRDSRTKVERTPLHLAAHAGHARVVALLLEHGAAVDCRDMLRMTPLHWAAARGHAGAARELLRRGADPRARCKFRQTPRCLAARRRHPPLLALLDAHTAGQISDETTKVDREFETIQNKQDSKPLPKIRIQPEKTIIIESKTEPLTQAVPSALTGGAGGGASSGAGGAAALLRAHGITLLPADRGCTVLTALRSGRTVVLSDAGKLMLKESNDSDAPTETTIVNDLTETSTIDASEAGETMDVVNDTGSSVVSGSGVVSVANVASVASVASAVRPGRSVKLVTLNKAQQPLKKIIHPNDLQQVKLVQVAGAGSRSRPALKLLLDKGKLRRLLAPPQAGAPESDEAGLRAQLAAARAALANMAAELSAARARLAQLEPR